MVKISEAADRLIKYLHGCTEFYGDPKPHTLEILMDLVEEKFTTTNKARQATETYAQISAQMLELAADPCQGGYVPISPETLREWAQKLLPC